MRVLVTGGHGFVGSHLVEHLLRAGDTVRILYRRPGLPTSLAGREVEILRGDVRDPVAVRRAVEGVEEVHHLAALTRSRTAREMFETNVAATEVLADAAIASGGIRRLLFCSSLAAVGPSPDGHALDEASPPRPRTWYGESKLRAEALLRARAHALPITIVRPPAVYGPWDRDFLAVFRAAERGILPLLGDANPLYSFVFAPDLAEAMVAAARHPATVSRTFFVSHPERVWQRDFLLHVAGAVGRRGRLLRVPDSTLRLAAAASETLAQLQSRPPLLNRQRLRELAGRAYVCDAGAFGDATGWRARTGVAAGTRQTARWYRERGWLSGRGRVDDAREATENPSTRGAP